MSNAFYTLPKKVLGQYGVSANGSSWLNLTNDGDFHPNLGLHFAALTGNLALVKFALQHGQPTTSVLSGLLPLHAACSGGDEATVAYLLSQGADVNAARLRASNGGSPGIGTEGSMALHFAAANGHSAVVRTLLEHGAHAKTLDGDGFTPEQLASSNGHAETALIIRAWLQSLSSKNRSSSSRSSNISVGYGISSVSSISSASQNDTGRSAFPSLRGQRSLDQLSLAAAGLKASFRNTRRQALAKVSSNPNLKSTSMAHSMPCSVPAVPPVPADLHGWCDSGPRCLEPPLRTSSAEYRLGQNGISCDRPHRRQPSLQLSVHRQAQMPQSGLIMNPEETDKSTEALNPLKQNLIDSPPENDVIQSSSRFPVVEKRDEGVLIETSVHRTSGRASPSSDANPFDDSDSLSSSSYFSTSSSRQLADYTSTVSSPPLQVSKSSSPSVDPDIAETGSIGSKIVTRDGSSKAMGVLETRHVRATEEKRAESISTHCSSQAIAAVQDGRSMPQVHQHGVNRDVGDDWQEYLADVQPRPAGLRKMQSLQRCMHRSSDSFKQTSSYERSGKPNNGDLTALTFTHAAKASNTSTNSSKSSGISRTDASSPSATGSIRPVANVSDELARPSQSPYSSISFDGEALTASEYADVIMHSDEGDDAALAVDGRPHTLTQLLAAYGEALARERKETGIVPPFKRQLSGSSIEGLVRKHSHEASGEDRRTRLYRQHSCPVVPEVVSIRQQRSNLGITNYSPSQTPNALPYARTKSLVRADARAGNADGNSGFTLCEESLADRADGVTEAAGESQALRSSPSNATLFNELRPGDWEGDVGQLSYIIKNCSISSPSKDLSVYGSSNARRSWCADEEDRDRSNLPSVGSELLHKHSPSLPVSLSVYTPSSTRTSTSTSTSNEIVQTRASTDQVYKSERRKHPTHAHKRNGAQIFTSPVISSPLADNQVVFCSDTPQGGTHSARGPYDTAQNRDRKDQSGRAALAEACLNGGAKAKRTGVMKALFSGLKGT